MGKKILFSPVGGTDPISENNYRDGSMLHICRHYNQIKLFYIYLSIWLKSIINTIPMDIVLIN